MPDSEIKVTWSHSSLKQFNTCARQYHEVRVLKNFKSSDTEQSLYGKRLHEQAELHIRDGRALDKEFTFLQPSLDAINAMPGRKLCEYEMALTEDLQPVDFKGSTYWVRGIADLVIVNDDNLTARIYDYKSGSDKYPDTDQLTLMSLMLFKHLPHLRRITSGLLFVLKGTLVRHAVEVQDADALWWKQRERVARIAAAHASGVWKPTQNGLCRKYCDVKSCEFNGGH